MVQLLTSYSTFEKKAESSQPALLIGEAENNRDRNVYNEVFLVHSQREAAWKPRLGFIQSIWRRRKRLVRRDFYCRFGLKLTTGYRSDGCSQN